jgi:hypothetical protein
MAELEGITPCRLGRTWRGGRGWSGGDVETGRPFQGGFAISDNRLVRGTR